VDKTFPHLDALSNRLHLPPSLEALLFETNPWWQGKPARPQPPFRRWLFHALLERLKSGLAPITVLRGPRQVGKTTLQMQVIQHLLDVEAVSPKRILRVQFDEIPSLKGVREPVLTMCRWFQHKILNKSFNESARDGEIAYVFFDEVQNIEDWAPQLKSLVDHHDVRVLVTGSSALRIEQGRDSLAGRITTLELGVLTLREIAGIRGFGDISRLLPSSGLGELTRKDFWAELIQLGKKVAELRDKAFEAFSERGAYPIAQAMADLPWEMIADQLNETIVRRVIRHDLRVGERGRKRDETLLEEVFKLCCRYAGQTPGAPVFVQQLSQALHANVGWQRVLAYLRFLSDTLLIRMVPPLEIRLKKKKGNAKICLCDHGLRASWLQEIVPIAPSALERSPHLHDMAGHIVESIVGYYLGSIPGLNLAWFPERSIEPEVDFVLTVGEYRIPIEVKYRRHIDPHRDTLGLRAFLEKVVYNAPFGLLITLTDDIKIEDPRIIPLPLPTLLLVL